MPRCFARPNAILSALPVSHYSTLERVTQRQTHDMLRHSVERLWHPFMTGRHGADLKAYCFSENLAELCTAGNTFTCQVNGVPGGKKVLEDFFATLVTGFDVVQVNVERASGSSLAEPRDMRNYRGYYVLEHTRPFLGWTPTPTSLRLPASFTCGSAMRSDEAAYGDEAGEVAQHITCTTTVQPEKVTVPVPPPRVTSPQTGSTLVVPFSTYVEGVVNSGRLSHLALRTPALELLSNCAECPAEVRQCLRDKEALKMFTTLRRAGVKPGIITARTLLSASKQNEAWTAALGIL
jgi:hypothetical protein